MVIKSCLAHHWVLSLCWNRSGQTAGICGQVVGNEARWDQESSAEETNQSRQAEDYCAIKGNLWWLDDVCLSVCLFVRLVCRSIFMCCTTREEGKIARKVRDKRERLGASESVRCEIWDICDQARCHQMWGDEMWWDVWWSADNVWC